MGLYLALCTEILHICASNYTVMLILSAMDVSYGAVYCYRCKDHVYDEDLDKVAGISPGFFGRLLLLLSHSV